MTSGFASLNTALSALRYTRVAMDVASDNIANISTEGYARRRVDSASVAGGATPAMWFRSANVGDGVAVTGVSRMTDELLNVRARREHGNQSFLNVQATALARVEDGIGEPGANGLSAALDRFQSAWGTLSMNPAGTSSSAARANVLAAAATVVDTARGQLRQVGAEAGDQRVLALTDASEVDTLGRDLAKINSSIVSGRLNGSNVNALLDSRDQIAGRMAELTGAVTTVQADGSATVRIGGAVLVEGSAAGSFTVASGVTPTGEADGQPLRFAVTSPQGGSAVVAAGGELGGVAQLLDVTFPTYLADLTAVVRDVADRVNTQHAAGYDAQGNAGAAVFSYDPADVLGTVEVALSDPRLLAASAGPTGADGDNAARIGELAGLGDGYQRLVSGFGASVSSLNRQAASQQVLTTQVDLARDQLGGVSLDEEMVNMTVLQRQYEAAARVMSTVDSLLDTLINRMGVG